MHIVKFGDEIIWQKYTHGDYFVISNWDCILPGILTTNAMELRFTVIVPYSIKDVSPIVQICKCNTRTPTGGYVGQSGWNNDGINYCVECNEVYCTKQNDFCFTVTCKKSSGWGATNNIPLAVGVQNLTVYMQ